MKYRTLRNEKLSAIGLGCMSMSHAYGTPNDVESIATLNLALASLYENCSGSKFETIEY
jgi:aryl-alcohol dehydrogenase-like predicted oxidoreductase